VAGATHAEWSPSMNEYSFEVKAVVRVKFILVNGRTPGLESFCSLCCEPIGDSYLREIATRLSYCDHKCYVGHCKVRVLALQNYARAS
jgi:hypothetical protein